MNRNAEPVQRHMRGIHIGRSDLSVRSWCYMNEALMKFEV